MLIVIDCTPGYVVFKFNVEGLMVPHSVEVRILLKGVGVNEEINPDFLASIVYVSETVNLLSPFASNLK